MGTLCTNSVGLVCEFFIFTWWTVVGGFLFGTLRALAAGDSTIELLLATKYRFLFMPVYCYTLQEKFGFSFHGP